MKQSKAQVGNMSRALKKNQKSGESRKVNKMLLKKAKHLQGVDSIQIYKYVEIMPAHNEQENREALERWEKKRKQNLGDDDDRIVGFDNQTLILHKSLLTNESWVIKHADLGLRIKKFINTEDPEIAVKTIKEYPDVLLYDGEQIELCLLISMPFEEYKDFKIKLQRKHMKELRELKGKVQWEPKTLRQPLYNPFRQHVLRWVSQTKWGNYQEQKEAKEWLKKANIDCFMKIAAGRPRGSVKVRVDKEQVRGTYDAIRVDLQKRFTKINHKFQAERLGVLKEYVEEKKIFDKLMSTNLMGTYGDYSNQREKVKFVEELSTLLPPTPSKIALRITSRTHDIKEGSLYELLFRNKRIL